MAASSVALMQCSFLPDFFGGADRSSGSRKSRARKKFCTEFTVRSLRADRATTAEPHAMSIGIDTVWVNGDVAFRSSGATGAYSGRVLRRGDK